MTTYVPFDQDKHLGPPPWKMNDPAVLAWEAAHNHDPRLECYVEFGCQALAMEHERLADEVYALRAENEELLAIVRKYAEMGHYTAKQYIANLEGGA